MTMSEITDMIVTLPENITPMIKGVHGMGKTELVHNIGKVLNLPVVTFLASEISDVGDIIGLPEIASVETDCGTIRQTRFNPTYWYDPCKPVLLFFDEVNRARPEISNALMRLTLEHKINDIELPKGSRVITAVNPSDNGIYDVDQMDPAKYSRYMVMELNEPVSNWISWMIEQKAHSAVISYIKDNNIDLDPYTNSSLLNLSTDGDTKLPDRRSWKHCSDWLLNAERILGKGNLTDTFVYNGTAGFVGSTIAGKFVKYYKSSTNVVTANDVLNKYNEVKDKVEKLDDADIAVLVNEIRVIANESKKRLSKNVVDNWKNFYYDLRAEVRKAITVDIVLSSVKKKENAFLKQLGGKDMVNEYATIMIGDVKKK